MNPSALELASWIDATNLKLDASDADIRKLCEEAALENYACVMIYPQSIPLAASLLKGTKIGLGTVIGFPSGRFCTASKAAEIEQSSKNGATEVDIVMNYSALREGRDSEVAAELKALTSLAHKQGQLIKVITENCFLSEAQMLRALVLCEEAGVDFIKTSTGFGSAGAKIEQIRLWAANRKGKIRLKAAGGIKCLADAVNMHAAGAARLGTSNASALLAELRGLSQAPAAAAAY